jgi:hypothetical protein
VVLGAVPVVIKDCSVAEYRAPLTPLHVTPKTLMPLWLFALKVCDE